MIIVFQNPKRFLADTERRSREKDHDYLNGLVHKGALNPPGISQHGALSFRTRSAPIVSALFPSSVGKLRRCWCGVSLPLPHPSTPSRVAAPPTHHHPAQAPPLDPHWSAPTSQSTPINKEIGNPCAIQMERLTGPETFERKGAPLPPLILSRKKDARSRFQLNECTYLAGGLVRQSKKHPSWPHHCVLTTKSTTILLPNKQQTKSQNTHTRHLFLRARCQETEQQSLHRLSLHWGHHFD